MQHSIASVCLSGDLRQKIEAAAAAGFEGIEIFENDLLLFDQSPNVVRQIAQDNGIDIIALQPFRDFEAMPAAKRQKNFDRAQRKFDLMDTLGTDTLLICSNVSPFAIDNFSRAVDDFSTLANMAQTRQFKVGYEALAWGRYVKDYQQAWELVKQVDHDHLGVILDSFHIFARGRDLSTIKEIPGNKITLIQIADAPWLDMDVLQWSRHFRCFPGQGDFPLVEFMQTVMQTGYQGYVSHEIFNDEFRSAPTLKTAIDGKRSLVWLQDQVRKVTPDLAANRQLEAAPPLPDADVQRVEFIEFAAAGEQQEQLVTLLTALGFKKTHQHRSKDVSLYKNDDVCLLINEEPDSFAQNHFLMRGLSVCATAFLTSDSAAISERAAHLGYPRFETHVENGELNIPALQGLGNELVYFVDKLDNGKRFYDVDFMPVGDTTPTSPFNIQVDHLASSIAESEFLSASLFYKIVFGLDIHQPHDLIDPYGLIVSRTATSKDKQIRLPFNMSRAGSASSERFRQIQQGSGVQHIALHCDDILTFVENVDPSILLPIPANYYDDLEARFSLDEDFAAQLRQYNLLYDQNETGHFIHFYTRAINGVFFEVVQRHQYGNYGEANAHVRMAAQARCDMPMSKRS